MPISATSMPKRAALDDLVVAQALARGDERRGEAQLGQLHPVAPGILHVLEGHPPDGFVAAEHLLDDREAGDHLLQASQGGEHPGACGKLLLRHAEVQPVAPGQLGYRAQAHAAVQVAVQLRLGQRAQRVLIEHIAPDRQSL
jgi:hypothetical protein